MKKKIKEKKREKDGRWRPILVSSLQREKKAERKGTLSLTRAYGIDEEILYNVNVQTNARSDLIP